MNSFEEIIIVSGLPRSGTSLMMQMLQCGGVKLVTDHLRPADEDNPRGYYEFEAARNIAADTSWIPQARGKAIKLVSLLLYHLPLKEHYRVLFMERDLEEVLNSQETMLKRLNRTAIPTAEMRKAYQVHLESLREWLSSRPDISLLSIPYRSLVEQPDSEVQRVCQFLKMELNTDAMVAAVDRGLYRNRRNPG